MSYLKRIRLDPAIRSGKLTARGTRITVHDILEHLASGTSQEEIPGRLPRPLSRKYLCRAALFRSFVKLLFGGGDQSPPHTLTTAPGADHERLDPGAISFASLVCSMWIAAMPITVSPRSASRVVYEESTKIFSKRRFVSALEVG